MKKLLFLITIISMAFQVNAQTISSLKVPTAVKTVFTKTHAKIKHILWEKENGNFEANWKIKGLKNAAMFTPEGKLIGTENGIYLKNLPKIAIAYLKTHEHTKAKEASLIKDANGEKTIEIVAKGKEYIFDIHGKFIKVGESD